MQNLHAALGEHLESPGQVNWYWPPWCLNQKAGQLEVYVFDDETNTGAWVPGIAQTRVVDPNGKDAYLHVQYVWDGEEYVEDFDPPRVRRYGAAQTVADLIRSGQLSQGSEPAPSPAAPAPAAPAPAAAPPAAPAPAAPAPAAPAPAAPMPAASASAAPVLSAPGGMLYAGAAYSEPSPPAAAPAAAPAAPLLPASSSLPSSLNNVAEIILECVEAEGVNVSRLPPGQRAIGFQVRQGEMYAKIGRQHQPEFFERVVYEKDMLTSISRSHFEISWEAAWPAPKLRQLSRNKLLVDSRLVNFTEGAPISIPDGTRLTFCGTGDSDVRFLVLRLTLRRVADVEAGQPHPAVLATMQQQLLGMNVPITTKMAPIKAVSAVLECVKAAGTDLSKLSPDVKAIPLEFDKPTDIGRNHQAMIFEKLLQAEPARLSFVSRTHCRVKLGKGPAPAQAGGYSSSGGQVQLLEVENQSMNVLFVGGQPLAKGASTTIPEGGTVAFAAAVTGDDTTFLEFRLRRAKQVPQPEHARLVTH